MRERVADAKSRRSGMRASGRPAPADKHQPPHHHPQASPLPQAHRRALILDGVGGEVELDEARVGHEHARYMPRAIASQDRLAQVQPLHCGIMREEIRQLTCTDRSCSGRDHARTSRAVSAAARTSASKLTPRSSGFMHLSIGLTYALRAQIHGALQTEALQVLDPPHCIACHNSAASVTYRMQPAATCTLFKDHGVIPALHPPHPRAPRHRYGPDPRTQVPRARREAEIRWAVSHTRELSTAIEPGCVRGPSEASAAGISRGSRTSQESGSCALLSRHSTARRFRPGTPLLMRRQGGSPTKAAA